VKTATALTPVSPVSKSSPVSPVSLAAPATVSPLKVSKPSPVSPVSPAAPAVVSPLKALFSAIDKNGDGTISKDEWAQARAATGVEGKSPVKTATALMPVSPVYKPLPVSPVSLAAPVVVSPLKVTKSSPVSPAAPAAVSPLKVEVAAAVPSKEFKVQSEAPAPPFNIRPSVGTWLAPAGAVEEEDGAKGAAESALAAEAVHDGRTGATASTQAEAAAKAEEEEPDKQVGQLPVGGMTMWDGYIGGFDVVRTPSAPAGTQKEVKVEALAEAPTGGCMMFMSKLCRK